MNTLELNFITWFNTRGFVADELLMRDLQSAFNAGYLAGFDHAKKEAIQAMSGALKEPTTP